MTPLVGEMTFPYGVIPIIAAVLIMLAMFANIHMTSQAPRRWVIFGFLRQSIKTVWKVVLFPLILIILAIYMKLIDYVMSFILEYGEIWGVLVLFIFVIILGLKGIIFVIFCLYQLYEIVVSFLSDRKSFRNATRSFTPDRQVIAEHFLSFHTDTFRGRYVTWLEEQELNEAERRRFGDEDNMWPTGRRPNIANDDASTRLAQLDTRWLGIERP